MASSFQVDINIDQSLWSSFENIKVRGFAFFCDEYYEGIGLAKLIYSHGFYHQTDSIIEKLNGMFAVISVQETNVFLATDITRTYPIFYLKSESRVLISDSTSKFNIESKNYVLRETIDEYLSAGFVTGNKTLLRGVEQVEAAEIVMISRLGVFPQEYWTYATGKVFDQKFEEYQNKLDSILSNVADRLVVSLNNRTAVIPLSGGYDSRLILLLLIERRYENIICFSYGSKFSFEMKYAKLTAKKLNIKFIDIQYDKNFIDKYFEEEEFISYIKFAANHVSLSHIQDFLAVKYLRNESKIPLDSVFLPGHSGDVFSGSHIPLGTHEIFDLEEIKKVIRKKHFALNPRKISDIKYVRADCHGYSNVEAWSWKERQSKFIVNSIRVYEYFGSDARLPLWDKELSNFFKAVPLQYKNRNQVLSYNISNNLYDSVLFKLFHKYDVGYTKTQQLSFLRKILLKTRAIIMGQTDGINNIDFVVEKLNKNKLKLSGDINADLATLYLPILIDQSVSD
jgi:asparagine synthase (glutamine-hydrolysing)